MRRRVLIGVGVGLGLLLVVDALAVRLGLAAGLVPKLEGTGLWTTSRAAGLTAYLALTMDVVFGLFLSTRAADRILSRATSVDVHRWLSSVALSLTGLHVVALLGDRFIRFDVLDALVPFLSSYRPVAVGLGVLAAYGAMVVQLSFWLRNRLGPKAWRKLHFVSFAVFFVALGHGLLAGSDAGRPGVQALYLGSLAAVVALGVHRTAGARRTPAAGRRTG